MKRCFSLAMTDEIKISKLNPADRNSATIVGRTKDDYNELCEPITDEARLDNQTNAD